MTARWTFALAVLIAVLAAGLAAAGGGGPGESAARPAPDRTIVATGLASAPVHARRSQGGAAIRRASAAAAERAMPRAVAAARRRATALAAASGLELGEVRAVADQVGGQFWSTIPGSRGTDTFCGRRWSRGRPGRSTCTVPPRVAAVATVTFAIG